MFVIFCLKSEIYLNQVRWEQAAEQGSKVWYKVLNEEQWQAAVSEKIVKENKENSTEIKKLESGQVYQVSVAATVVVGEKIVESRHVVRLVWWFKTILSESTMLKKI